MRKKVITDVRYCDTCKLAKWVTDKQWNYDIYGKPLTLSCPNREHGINRGTKTCDKYK